MTKIDFAIHLFTAARTDNGTGHRHISGVVMIVMLELARRDPEGWHRGPELSRALGIDQRDMAAALRGAVKAEILQSRPGAKAKQGGTALEWHLPPKGRDVITRMLDTSSITRTPVLAR